METPMEIDRDGNVCFGCSPTNERGLRLRFVQVGEHAVECRWTAPEHVCGSPGVVHGGIQASLLDETFGYAVRTVVGTDRIIVTAELSVAYRRPVPSGQPLVVRAGIERAELPDVHVRGAITLRDDEGETELTRGTSRWKVLDETRGVPG